MAERDDELNKIIKNFLKEIQKIFKIDDAYLFGSYAKGTAGKWSDIDIAIVSSDFSDDLFEDRLKLMRLASAVDDRIEPKPFKKELFNADDPLVDEIQKNGIRLM
jgi:predicted nucleotidyltransferase